MQKMPPKQPAINTKGVAAITSTAGIVAMNLFCGKLSEGKSKVIRGRSHRKSLYLRYALRARPHYINKLNPP